MSPPAIQGVALPNSKQPGYSSIYRNVRAVDGIKKVDAPEVTTLFESFERSVKQAPKSDCMGHREYDRVTKVWSPYIWQSYETVQQRRNHFGSGLLSLFEEVARVFTLFQHSFYMDCFWWVLGLLTFSLLGVQSPMPLVALLSMLLIVQNGC